ncbi:Abi family protein [Marinobacterium lutimaris]|uniref:Abortive infection bacteriophage resistance protein n=1 Tax=Marinobacterium lutimaris TaxID=568106 RepID=A0A1H5VEL0_9GAMM|nr:Abi family protein [Marinobacterium lutimaris]SEF85802.1 Abortive infection bacteriophage resistance protein [Marinobacterium lutimaris]
MGYGKPWLSIEEQLAKLEQNGLSVTDHAKALQYLQRVGYYRLSGYWFPFRERTGKACRYPEKPGKPSKLEKRVQCFPLDKFKSGLSFQDAVDLYVFDKRLRLLVMDALERIEIALRVDISHTLGARDPFAYLNPEHLDQTFTRFIDPKTGLSHHHAWLANHARLIQRSREDFIKHNKERYGFPIAIWVACEVWDFGCMSKLFDGLKPGDQDQISQRYGISNGGVFASWLRSLNYLRNVCAHHSRLWNRNIVDQPKKPGAEEALYFAVGWESPHIQARPFLLLCIVQFLLQTVNPASTWWQRLTAHLISFPLNSSDPALTLEAMGVIKGWNDWEW